LGTAYIHGFRWGLAHGYDFLIQMDADWSHHPAYLREMLVLSTAVDFVVGSRYVEGGGTTNWGWGRRLLSRAGSLYSSLILDLTIRDLTGGFNGWRLPVLKAIGLDSLRSDGYSFQIELKLRASRLRFRPAEFPIIFAERRAGQSKMSAGIVCEGIWRVWQFRRSGKSRLKKIRMRDICSRTGRTPVLLAAVVVSLFAPKAIADVKLPQILSDPIVLQQSISTALWGTTDGGEEVSVSFRGQKVSSSLALQQAGGPEDMTSPLIAPLLRSEKP